VNCKSTAEYGKMRVVFLKKKDTSMVALCSGGQSAEPDVVEFSIWMGILLFNPIF